MATLEPFLAEVSRDARASALHGGKRTHLVATVLSHPHGIVAGMPGHGAAENVGANSPASYPADTLSEAIVSLYRHVLPETSHAFLRGQIHRAELVRTIAWVTREEPCVWLP
jgi:hypothetical protein